MKAYTAVKVLAARAKRLGGDPVFVPDLTLWHRWHSSRGSLPERWKAASLAEICGDLGVPAWDTARPWRMRGIQTEVSESPTERIVKWGTRAGTLQARWTMGPDGDWWQAEHPVKSSGDLAAAKEIVSARVYEPDQEEADGHAAALELPMRPYSDLLHNFLGWDVGVTLLVEEPEALGSLIGILEEKLRELEKAVAAMQGAVVLSPDNLDGQFISPPAFEEHLAPSYARAAQGLHSAGKILVVHAGGPLRRLLPGLAKAGIDCVEGICGPPQSDASLAEARRLCGSDMVLWGGIAQDNLLERCDQAAFEAAVAGARDDSRADPCMVLGVADKVPVNAKIERLESLARMAGGRRLS